MASGEFDILVPEATKNLILNPSVENDLDNWIPEWNQEATLEDQELTPNPTGFDTQAGGGVILISNRAAIRGNWGMELDRILLGAFVAAGAGTLDDPDGEDEIVSEMYINTQNLAAVGAAEFWRIMDTVGTLPAILYIDDNAGDLILNLTYGEDGGNTTVVVDTLLPNTMYKIRFHQKYASAPAANDGFARVYINDALGVEATGLDSDTGEVNQIRYGAVAVNNMDGTLFVDNCRWADTDVPFTGCSIERSLERARFGRYSAKVYTDGYSVNEGPYTRIDTSDVQGMVTASAYVRGNGDIRIRVFDGLNGRQSFSQTITVHDRYWQRIEVPGTAYGSDDYRVYIETAGNIAQEATFYVDAVQLEEKAEISTYCDGTQPGCQWNGVAYKSTSERESTEMNGGVWTPIKEDPCDPDTYFTNMFGLGMPPLTINRQRMALSPGAFFDSERVEERPFGMTITVRDQGANKRTSAQIKKIWDLRQRLDDLLKPDNNPDNEPFWLRYRQDEGSLMIRAFYESGLSFDGDVRNKYFNIIPLRFLALDPFWYEDSQEVALLTTENDLGDDIGILARFEERWQTFGQAFNGWPFSMTEDAEKRLYIGGNYSINSDDGLPNRRFSAINDAYTRFIERGLGLDDDVDAIAASPNGKIYLGGFFLNDNLGNPLVHAAEYDPVTNALSAMGGGIDDPAAFDIHNVFVAPNGWIYYVGNFQQVDGNVDINSIAYWDGGAWHNVGDPEGDIGVALINLYDVWVVSEDEIYAVGDTADVTTEILFYWDGSSWISLYETGAVGGRGAGIVQDNDGTFLIGGRKSSVGGSLIAALWRWNGSAMVQLGDDLTGVNTPIIINDVAIDSSGLVICAGNFEKVGDIEIDAPVIFWNGSSFVPADVVTPTNTNFGTLFVDSKDNIYIFPEGALFDNVEASGLATVENKSTTDTFPIITFTASGRLIWLENLTSGQRVFLNYTIQEDEIVTMDFRTGIKSIESNYKGSIPDAILPASDDFFLLAGKKGNPKDNKILLLISDEVTPTAQLRYQPTHWSVDAISTL